MIIVIVYLCVAVRRRRRCVSAEYLDLYWSRAAVCSGGVPVYACVVLVDTLWIRFSIARLPAGIQ